MDVSKIFVVGCAHETKIFAPDLDDLQELFVLKTLLPQKVIKGNRNIIHREIQEEQWIDSYEVDIILHKHLRVRRLATRWIPYLLTEKNEYGRNLC